MSNGVLYIGRLGADAFPVCDPDTMKPYIICKTEKEALDYLSSFDFDNPPPFLETPALASGTVTAPSVSSNPIPSTSKQSLANSSRLSGGKSEENRNTGNRGNIRRRK